jgi:hypothetical protein
MHRFDALQAEEALGPISIPRGSRGVANRLPYPEIEGTFLINIHHI